MPCLLSSKPESFTKFIDSSVANSNGTSYSNNSFALLPLNNTNILSICDSQIFVFSSIDLEIKEEIILDWPIKDFQYNFHDRKLLIELNSDGAIGSGECDSELENVGESANTSVPPSTTVNTAKSTTSTTSSPDIITVTSKLCTWSLDLDLDTQHSPLVNLTFSTDSNSNLVSCTKSTLAFTSTNPQIQEIIKGQFVASLTDQELTIFDKNDRKMIISRVKLPEQPATEMTIKSSLIWIGNEIFIFYARKESLKILKYPIIQFSSPTNGCNAPLVCWTNDIINVHRAGAINPTWYKLKNNEVWDVLNSPVGKVLDVQVSADGSCLLVCGDLGVAFCDFIKRSWKPLKLTSLSHPKWIGSDHVVALVDQNKLILISRDQDNILTIPSDEDAQEIIFIDTYNNWQLLLQFPTKMDIYALNSDNDTCNFSLIKSIPMPHQIPLKQAAHLKDSLYLLNQSNQFFRSMINETKMICEDCESFVILSTGHILINKYNQTSALYHVDNDHKSLISIGQSPLALLPNTNCLTLLLITDTYDSNALNFSLNSSLQSKFLLPKLFSLNPCQSLLSDWSDDPLYPLALEYILLDSLGNPETLSLLDRTHAFKHKTTMSRAIIALTRKIESHEATQKLFNHLPSFSPLEISKSLSPSDLLNFLPYLAKSYFENVDERKDSIVLVLEGMFSKRQFYFQIGKVKEYLSAFADLEALFTSSLETKIQKLSESGRVFKAFELQKSIETATNLENTPNLADFNEKNPITQIDALISAKYSPTTHATFHSRLNSHKSPI